MIRRPPRSPLFPYTTLSRSRTEHRRDEARHLRPRRGGRRRRYRQPARQCGRRADRRARLIGRSRAYDVMRSEEHTSELQSQSNLVCRLLLEKKKKTTTPTTATHTRAPSTIPFSRHSSPTYSLLIVSMTAP